MVPLANFVVDYPTQSNMSVLFRSVGYIGKKLIFPEFRRSITLSPVTPFKEIIETREGKTLTIEGKIVPDPDESRLIKNVGNGSCPLCSLGLELKHTDVLILRQFLRPDGCIIPRRITGLCVVQQRRLENLVAMAQKAGLMINMTPSWCNKDPKRRGGWKKYNIYFDEETIRSKYYGVTYRK